MLTMANLACGAMATISILCHHDYATALWLVVLAAIFDFFDGFAARLLGQTSPLGVQLDSLADDISFGLVPAVAMFDLYQQSSSALSLSESLMMPLGYLTLLVAVFSALRLGKFNIDTTQHDEFEGLPTPANALMLLSFVVQGLGFVASQELILLVSLLSAYLLVSPVRMFSLKFKGFGWRGNELRYIFLLVSALILIFDSAHSFFLVIVLYIAISAVRWVAAKRKKA